VTRPFENSLAIRNSWFCPWLVRACPPGGWHAIRGGADSNFRPRNVSNSGQRFGTNGVKIGARSKLARQSGPETSFSSLSARFPSNKEEKIPTRKSGEKRAAIRAVTDRPFFGTNFHRFFPEFFFKEAGGIPSCRHSPFPCTFFGPKFWRKFSVKGGGDFPGVRSRGSSRFSGKTSCKFWAFFGQESGGCQCVSGVSGVSAMDSRPIVQPPGRSVAVSLRR